MHMGMAALWCTFALVFTGNASWAESGPVGGALHAGDYNLSLQELQQLAEKGDAEAELHLGLLYDIGHGVAQNFAEATAWYRRAAEHGNVTAMFNMGIMYDNGRGVAMDRREAALWYERAAMRDFGRAQYNLALMLEHGDGEQRNLARAVHLYRLAAANGVSAAEHRLTVVASLEAPALRTPRQDYATYDLLFARIQAAILQRGLSSINAVDVRDLVRAAAHGSAIAAYDLGYCFEVGIGVPVNKLEAYVWYSRAGKARPAPSAKAAAAEAARQIRVDLSEVELEKARAMLGEPAR